MSQSSEFVFFFIKVNVILHCNENDISRQMFKMTLFHNNSYMDLFNQFNFHSPENCVSFNPGVILSTNKHSETPLHFHTLQLFINLH